MDNLDEIKEDVTKFFLKSKIILTQIITLILTMIPELLQNAMDNADLIKTYNTKYYICLLIVNALVTSYFRSQKDHKDLTINKES